MPDDTPADETGDKASPNPLARAAARRASADRPDARAAREEAEREAAASAEPMTERPSFSMGASHVRFLDALAWKAGPGAGVSRSEIVRAVVRGMMDAADAGADVPSDPAALRSWVASRLGSAE